jgi:Zn-dependent M28 family amino/carboxypeptidase
MKLIVCSTLIFLLAIGQLMAEETYVYPELDVSVSNLKETVKFLVSIQPYRNFTNPASLNKAAGYIEEKFKEFGLSTEIQHFQVEGETYKNVIGSYGKDKEERIIVGAHYDVCGDQPGADDNASAVAGLLEIAQLAGNYASASKYRFDFVAYSLEEPPYFRSKKMGSYFHAKSIYDQGVTIRGMICLEMIGYFTDEKNSQRFPLPFMKMAYPSEGNFIAVVGNFSSRSLITEVVTHFKHAAIKAESLKAPALLPGVDFSDHRNYWYFGYKAVMITDTAFYRNPNYHRRGDTIDTLDFEKMGEVVKGITWTLVNMD